MPQESRPRTPIRQRGENGGQSDHLSDLHAAVEAQDVDDHPLGGHREVLQLGRETEAVEEAEHEHGDASVGLRAEEEPEPVDVVERLVDHRQPDDGVDEIWVGANAAENAGEHVTLCPIVKRLTYWITSFRRYRKKITPIRNAR